ncbi:MAG: hypothetical protein CBC13_01625 [Planctomycetia bacterium TMED53]|nr:MAG: hypothetical protein CBC13_01625 [Planctomycetia bacterium TMED53]
MLNSTAIRLNLSFFSILLALFASSPVRAQSFEQVDAGRGGVTVQVSNNYTPGTPAPLLMLLHGRAWDGDSMEGLFELTTEANNRGYIYCYPDGLATFTGVRYWNATDACCCQGFPFTSCEDDVSYLTDLIAVLQNTYSIDPERIHLIGHSNGGFMSHRIACERSELITSIISVSGMTWSNSANCTPAVPVPVLQVHGTLDPIIFYGGGILGAGVYPSAQETCEAWASLNGCSTNAISLPNLDLTSASGSETEVLRWENGCNAPGTVELWSLGGTGHLPNFNDTWRSMIFDFMENAATPPASFIRGDVNGDQSTNISDVIGTLQYLFAGVNLDCLESANCNGDGSLDLSDAVYLLLYLFSGGTPPESPHPACGTGPVFIACDSGICP